MPVGVRKEKHPLSWNIQLLRRLETCLNQLRLDNNDSRLAASQVVGEFERRVARVTASVHAAETDNAVHQDRIVEGIEGENADAVAVLQAKLPEARC